MGREIRKVPKDWQHPKNALGRYQPMLEDYYNDVLEEWLANNRLWEQGKHPDQESSPEYTRALTYAQWYGDAPDPQYYNRNKWSSQEANCFQVYETITEGTPVSPVFDTLEQVEAWLVQKYNYTPDAAAELCRTGRLPTFTGQIKSDSGLLGLDEARSTESQNQPSPSKSKKKRRKPGKL